MCLILWPFLVTAQDTVSVFAAASLRGALEAASRDFIPTLRTSYGGSAAIARQIAQGAEADLVILAHPQWDAWLAGQTRSIADNPILIRNRLVLIGPADAAPFEEAPTPETLSARLGDGRLAMGQRDAVPAGQYGREWLQSLGAWTPLQRRLAEAENVRAAMAFVARKEVPLGIVYASDAQADPNVRVLWTIDPNRHTPITYPARAFTQKGLRLLEHLETLSSQTRMALLGFQPGERPE